MKLLRLLMGMIAATNLATLVLMASLWVNAV